MTTQRQQAYLQAVNDELHRLIDSGMRPDLSEHLAHAHAAAVINQADAVREALMAEVPKAAENGAAWQRGRTQGKGAARANATARDAKSWIIEQWQLRKHESRFTRLNARRGTDSPPSRKTFAEYMAAPGGPLEKQFPGETFKAKTVTDTWLKGLD